MDKKEDNGNRAILFFWINRKEIVSKLETFKDESIIYIIFVVVQVFLLFFFPFSSGFNFNWLFF